MYAIRSYYALRLMQQRGLHLLDVVQMRRPVTRPDAGNAADDLGDVLQEQEESGDRDDRLEMEVV